jgi:hypothetical protein
MAFDTSKVNLVPNFIEKGTKFASPHIIAHSSSDVDCWTPTQEIDLRERREERKTLDTVQIADAISLRKIVVIIY